MPGNSNNRRRGAALWVMLLSYGKLAAVPALIVGLLTLNNLLDRNGFTPKRLVIVVVCALIVLAAILLEKNEKAINKRISDALDGRTNAIRESAPKPAEPAEPISNNTGPAGLIPTASKPSEADQTRGKWQIGWSSGALDDIGLVYEKAEADEKTADMLSRLESLALSEARQYCGTVSTFREGLTPEGFDRLSAAQREAVIVLLGEKGFQGKRTDVANREIVVALSPVIQSILGCAMFKLLNWLEKMDGALNEMVDGKVTLTFQVPLGGRKGLVQWEMLIMRLYPWLCIRENPSDAVAVALSDTKREGGPAKAPEPSLDAELSSGGTPKRSSPVPPSGADLSKDDAVRALRDRIIADIAGKPCKQYELSGLLWDDAASCFPDGMRWDGAWFYLDLSSGKLSARVSTYPNQFGASRDAAFLLSASEFHRIATQYNFSLDLQQFETQEDWVRLFDDRLKAAVADALAKVRRQEEENSAKLREKYAVRIPSGSAAGAPKMSVKRVLLELNQMYGSGSLTLTRERGTYLLSYELRCISTTNNRSLRREVSAAEAAWIEERIERAIKDPDASTWHSLPGGDTMNIDIQREWRGGVILWNVEPIRKYSNLLNDLENLVRYGSIEA